ncbi:MAG TPA: GTPase Era [Alphaproteobacteria bacterium]|nr:GTPase Era [Alphaproteobacteria bacterium]
MTGKEKPATRCGVVAVMGAPNAGKSTLVNAMVGSKVSIVSPKVQTTRTRVTGVGIEGAAQIIFLDTPGVFAPRRRLDRAMVDAAWRSAAEADAVLLLIDAKRGVDDEARALIAGLAERRIAAELVLNKIDLIKHARLLTLAAELNGLASFTDTFMVSAENGDGVADLKRHLAGRMPEGPWLYPEDDLTDMPARLLAAEVTREHAYRQLRQELPYSLAVETEAWTEQPDGSAKIDQVIYVRKDSQRKIVIGAKGAQVKAIGAAARAELTKVLGRKIHLFLHVKVQENWDERREFYKEWGLEYNV